MRNAKFKSSPIIGFLIMVACVVVILMMAPYQLVNAQYDYIKEFNSIITVDSTDGCMITVMENITFYTSVFGVKSFERDIPTNTNPTKYSWINSVSASVTGVLLLPSGINAVSGLSIDTIQVQSNSSMQSIILTFSALDSIPKSTLLSFNLNYKMLGPIGFFTNSSGLSQSIVLVPYTFSVPVSSLNITFYFSPLLLSSTTPEPFLISDSRVFNQTFTTPSNDTITFTANANANELLQTGFTFTAISYSMCYIPYNLMEGWVVGAIVGSTLALPTVFVISCSIVTIVRYFTVDRHKQQTLLPAHQV